MGISSNPTNQNLAQPSKFLLSFDRLPNLTFFCTKVNLPGVTLGEAVQNNPLVDVPVAGDKIVYDSFDVTFLIDEELLAWTTVLDWIKGLGFPETTDQYKNLPLQQKLQLGTNRPQYSDAIVTIYTNKNNPVLQMKFVDLFPTNVSGLQFDVSQSSHNVMTAMATFRFANYSILRL